MRRNLIAVAFVLCAATADAGPLADSLKWAFLPASSAAFDVRTSVAWSSRPVESFRLNTCTEKNTLHANADGTVNGPKAAMLQGAITAGLVSVLYLAKRQHWKPLESVSKVAISAQSAQWTYYGVKSLALCR